MFGVPWPDLNEGLCYSETVKSHPEHAERILDYYASHYQRSASREGWLKRILRGQIEVNGEVVSSPEFLLRDKSCLVYKRLPWEEPSAPFMLQILFEDEHLLAVNKPSGLQVLPAGLFQQRTVLSQLQWRARDSGEACPTPVHRLGRGTSGVLLCAKSDQARSALGSKLTSGTLSGAATNRSQLFTKLYRALVTGIVVDDQISIEQPIGKVNYPGVNGGLYMAVSKGKASRSRVTTLHRNKEQKTSIVQVEIYSGRAHQIRIHMASIGHPLVGDPLYISGGKPSEELLSGLNDEDSVAEDGGYERPANPLPGDCGYYLHAHQLNFTHPVTNETLNIEAPLPPELEI